MAAYALRKRIARNVSCIGLKRIQGGVAKIQADIVHTDLRHVLRITSKRNNAESTCSRYETQRRETRSRPGRIVLMQCRSEEADAGLIHCRGPDRLRIAHYEHLCPGRR